MAAQKKEFSKIIFVLVTIMVFIVTVFSLLMVWLTRELQPLNWLIIAWFSEMAVITGFYYNKAKNENMKKIERAGESIRPPI